MTNYVMCPTCGRQTTARKARSHQQACRKKQAVRPNTGVQPTAELAGRESVATDPITERQPAAADA